MRKIMTAVRKKSLGPLFKIGAGAIGLALMIAGRNIGRIYAANLIGSAVGLMFATVAMSLVAPEWLAVWMAGLVLVGADLQHF